MLGVFISWNTDNLLFETPLYIFLMRKPVAMMFLVSHYKGVFLMDLWNYLFLLSHFLSLLSFPVVWYESCASSFKFSWVPPEYEDLLEVFSKKWTSYLPPHHRVHSWLTVWYLPSSRKIFLRKRFSISSPEIKAIENYIRESLASGFIYPPRGNSIIHCGEKG